MKKLKLIIVGCGNRGNYCYGAPIAANPDKFEVVAIAEPLDGRRNEAKELFGVKEEMCFKDWRDIAKMPKFADAVLVTTQDDMHKEPAIAFMDLKYDLLLEKPMAPTPEECMEIVNCAVRNNVKVLVCHVLRYTPFYTTLKKLLLDGVVGDIVCINHNENVGNVHQSHSYVRGDWHNSKTSSPMILAKCCHDTDLLFWLVGKKCKKIQSFGSLSYFREENAPEGCADRCIDGCKYEKECFYDAKKVYLGPDSAWWMRSACTKKPSPTDEEVEHSLRTTQFGKCVFKCENDVVDHQTVNIEFEDGETATLTMCAFNKGGRYTRIMGTKGELTAAMEEDHIDVYDFATQKTTQYKVADFVADSAISGGHGGGDTGIVDALYEYLNDAYKGFSVCSIEDTAQSHMMCFASELSRIAGGAPVNLNEYIDSFGKK